MKRYLETTLKILSLGVVLAIVHFVVTYVFVIASFSLAGGCDGNTVSLPPVVESMATIMITLLFLGRDPDTTADLIVRSAFLGFALSCLIHLVLYTYRRKKAGTTARPSSL